MHLLSCRVICLVGDFLPLFPLKCLLPLKNHYICNSSLNNCTAELSVALGNALCCFYSHITEQVLSALSRKQMIAKLQSFVLFFLVRVFLDSGYILIFILASTRRMPLIWCLLQLHFCCAVKQLHSGFRIWSYWMDVSFWILWTNVIK